MKDKTLAKLMYIKKNHMVEKILITTSEILLGFHIPQHFQKHHNPILYTGRKINRVNSQCVRGHPGIFTPLRILYGLYNNY